jgi:hypothetical protein
VAMDADYGIDYFVCSLSGLFEQYRIEANIPFAGVIDKV